jgi:hypothetical protein
MIQLKRSNMTMPQLEATPEFQRCSRKQRFFIQTLIQSLISTGIADQVYATQCSRGNDGESARTESYRIMHTKKITDVIRVYETFGKSAQTIQREAKKAARQQYIETVKAEMDAAPAGSAARARLVELYGSLVFGAHVSKPSKKSKGKSNGHR